MYEYKATLGRVVDGDTVYLTVNLGFHISAYLSFRLLGVDTPELRGGTVETKELANKAKDFVKEQLEQASSITITTEKADGFGRWLADINYTIDDTKYNLSQILLEKDLAEVYSK